MFLTTVKQMLLLVLSSLIAGLPSAGRQYVKPGAKRTVRSSFDNIGHFDDNRECTSDRK